MSKRPPLRPGATRRAYINRTTRTAKSTKPIKAVNPERLAKRRKSYAQKLAAYRRSETYTLVQERAGGLCEHEFWKGGRCVITRGLQHHHKTYARFGGSELPEDIKVLCEYHHALAEAAFPNRRHGR